jgi:hypothetical protein
MSSIGTHECLIAVKGREEVPKTAGVASARRRVEHPHTVPQEAVTYRRPLRKGDSPIAVLEPN